MYLYKRGEKEGIVLLLLLVRRGKKSRRVAFHVEGPSRARQASNASLICQRDRLERAP